MSVNDIRSHYYAAVTDGRITIGLHGGGFEEPTLTFVSPDISGRARTLLEAGHEVLIDDRDERPGVMFADLELLGIPHRVVIGERSLDRGVAEYRHRSSGEEQELGLDNLAADLSGIIDS